MNMMMKKNQLLLLSLSASLLMVTACQPKSTDTQASATSEQGDAQQVVANTSETNDLTAAGVTDEHAHHDMHDMAVGADNEVQQAYLQGMTQMHDDMQAGMQANDADVAFAKGMLPHHQGAVAMAEVQLKYGSDPTMRKLAEDIIKAQQAEIQQMQQWIAANPDTAKQDNTEAMQQAYEHSMQQMHDDMMTGIQDSNPDVAFAKGMLPHHQGAVAMSQVELEYGKDTEMRKLAEDIIAAQQSEIELMQNWLAETTTTNTQ